jgi:hypothetical protein
VLAGIELRWIEIDALAAWPALEDFLAIIARAAANAAARLRSALSGS